MANALFDFGRQGILDDTIEMSTADVRAMYFFLLAVLVVGVACFIWSLP
jgi:hypothetical protein